MSLLISIANNFLPVFYVLSFLALGVLLWKKSENSKLLLVTIIFIVLVRVGYSLLLSVLQYLVWNSSDFGKILLSSPLTSLLPGSGFFNFLGSLSGGQIGYFLFYVATRFFLPVLISLFFSLLFSLVFTITYKWKGGISKNEPLIAFIASFLSGWPGFIIFIGFFLITSLVYSLILFWKGLNPRSFTFPLIFSSLLSVLFAEFFISFFNLGIFRI